MDLDALAQNVRGLKARIGGRTELLAVVKANAYGHGASVVAQAALEAGASRLGVACVDEGVQLRQAGIQAPILVMGHLPLWQAELVLEHRLTPTLSYKQLALALAGLSHERGIVIPVHVKVDTGMSRFGLLPQEAIPFIEFLQTLPGLHLEGLYTHFAVADEQDKTFTRQQFARFMEVANRFPQISCRHVANSATVLDMPELCLDMARPGISLYGLYPSSQVSHSVALKPVLSLKSLVARLLWLSPGDTVSYGRTWRAESPTRIALIPCGYADGLRRGLSNRGSVLVRGRRAPILGRICMDQFMADVTHIPEVALGDEVVLIGRQGEEEITADEIAALEGTISYEIVCGISARVPRVYLRAGQVVGVQTLNSAEAKPALTPS